MTGVLPTGLPAMLAPYELERRLGDPADLDGCFGYARSAELDRDERFPTNICRRLDELGLPGCYVPVAHGGTLDRYDRLVELLRVISRRDLTVTVAHAKTFLGAASVWVAGDAGQAGALAREILAGVPVSWGLTERAHGSDLMSSAVIARPVPGGYLVRGEKWPINNATRGEIICVLARTRPTSGARGLSLLLIDKRKLVPGSFQCLPKVLTHGIRGADISGIAFTDAEVPHTAIVGAPGDGVEIVLKALQLTRTVCTGLSLGAADHALRLTAKFADQRVLYGRRIAELDHVRRTLGECCAMLLAAEAVTVVAARGVHALTGEMSVVSAIAKSFVPSLVDELVTGCAGILGARGYLTGVFEHGMFAKLERDHRIVGIFDGSTFVNQSVLINQFPTLVRGYRAEVVDEAGLQNATDMRRELTGPNLSRLALLSRDGCAVVQSLPDAARRLRGVVIEGGASARLVALAERLWVRCDRLHDDMSRSPLAAAHEVSPSAFAFARQYELCFAGAAALRLWLANRGSGPPGRDPLWTDALWLEAVLTIVLSRLDPDDPLPDAVYAQLPGAMGVGEPARPPTSFLFGEPARAAR